MRLSIIPEKDGEEMLETLGDMISLVVTAGFVIAGVIVFFMVSNEHYAENMKEREDRYYSFLEDMDDRSDDDNSGPYYG